MTADKETILILEDDRDLAEELAASVQMAGYDVVVCTNIARFNVHVAQHEVDLLVIDLGLPDGYGLDVIRDVRAKSDVPIIITSGRSEVEDRVAGIELGADDYLGKPYNAREILAKISRMLTRNRGKKFSSRIAHLTKNQVLEFGGFNLDFSSMSLRAPGGQLIPLTTFEYLALKALAERPNHVLTRAVMVDSVHTQTWHGSERTIDNLVSRVRSKLGEHSDEDYIKTVRGVGYMFSCSDHKLTDADDQPDMT